MVKPLTFKGDKKPKKRKQYEVTPASLDSSEQSSNVNASEDDSWTSPADGSELTGPTVIVLPTLPPTCLAADLNGNIFASPLENLVDGNPKTAEPHTVQQVWVGSRVAGMAPNEINFKGSHGGYLSCDQYGILGAKREARGKEELFILNTISSGEDGNIYFQLRTAATAKTAKVEEYRYLAATTDVQISKKNAGDDGDVKKISVTIRGDVEATSEDTRMILRMQTRFKPQSYAIKETARAKEKISRRELESAAGRSLTDEEAKRLKRAKREGTYHEAILDVRAKSKHDKFA